MFDSYSHEQGDMFTVDNASVTVLFTFYDQLIICACVYVERAECFSVEVVFFQSMSECQSVSEINPFDQRRLQGDGEVI